MARKHKVGLDYFSLDVDFHTDEKIQFVSSRFGLKGEGIVLRLLCRIYRNGYYTEWDDDTALLFAGHCGGGCNIELVKDVVYELLKRGFFDRSIFERFGILTSRGIQTRFLSAITERKNVKIISEYWIGKLPEDTKKTTFEINPVVNPQSKVK